MSHPIKAVCVYCGSRKGNSPSYENSAKEVGRMIGEAGLSLVYGAGSIGLMGVVARAAIEAGSPVIGIIPEHLDEVEIIQGGLSETHITANMHDRKKMMFDRSDAFIILPGGLGTLDETFEIITWAQLSLHKKPIILINQDGYWDHFIHLFHHVVQEGFADADNLDLIQIVDDADSAIRQLVHMQVEEAPSRSALF